VKKYYTLKNDVVEIRPFILGEDTEQLYIRQGHTPVTGDMVLIMETGKFTAHGQEINGGQTFMDLIPAAEFAAQFVQVHGIVKNILGETSQSDVLAIQEAAAVDAGQNAAPMRAGRVPGLSEWLKFTNALHERGWIQPAALDAGQPSAEETGQPSAEETGQPSTGETRHHENP